jgi:hypothetical protein
MDEVAVALRYGATPSLPLASMYRATQCQVPVPEDEKLASARAFGLTNQLLANGTVVEVNVIASRLVLAHERALPAIYALRRGQTEPRLSDGAKKALEFIADNASGSSGDIRRLLRVEGQRRPDAADLALSELQRELLVDRGPSSGPGQGVFYLSKEGYPYRMFMTAHPRIASVAAGLSRGEAAAALLSAYLGAAVFATRRKLTSLFQLLLTADEIDAALAALTGKGILTMERGALAVALAQQA